MFSSLMKLKELPQKYKNLLWSRIYQTKFKFLYSFMMKITKILKLKIKDIEIKLKNRIPTIPSTIKDELECNIFLRSTM